MGDDLNVAYELGLRGDHEGAIRIYSNYLKRFEESSDPEVLHTVVDVMDNLALELAQAGRAREAMRTLDRLIARYSDSVDPELQGAVRHAKISKLLVKKSAPIQSRGRQRKMPSFPRFWSKR